LKDDWQLSSSIYRFFFPLFPFAAALFPLFPLAAEFFAFAAFPAIIITSFLILLAGELA
jgi:hypothetical protein